MDGSPGAAAERSAAALDARLQLDGALMAPDAAARIALDAARIALDAAASATSPRRRRSKGPLSPATATRRREAKLQRCEAINDLLDGHANRCISFWIELIRRNGLEPDAETVQLADMYAEQLLQQLMSGQHKEPINFTLPPTHELQKLPTALRTSLSNQLKGVSRAARLGSPARTASPSRGGRLGSPPRTPQAWQPAGQSPAPVFQSLAGQRSSHRLASPGRRMASPERRVASPGRRLSSPRRRLEQRLGSPPRSSPRKSSARKKAKKKRPSLASLEAATAAAARQVPRADQRALIAHTAHWVGIHGPELENNIRVKNTTPSYGFLSDPKSAEGKLYAALLARNISQHQAEAEPSTPSPAARKTPRQQRGGSERGGSGQLSPEDVDQARVSEFLATTRTLQVRAVEQIQADEQARLEREARREKKRKEKERAKLARWKEQKAAEKAAAAEASVQSPKQRAEAAEKRAAQLAAGAARRQESAEAAALRKEEQRAAVAEAVAQASAQVEADRKAYEAQRRALAAPQSPFERADARERTKKAEEQRAAAAAAEEAAAAKERAERKKAAREAARRREQNAAAAAARKAADEEKKQQEAAAAAAEKQRQKAAAEQKRRKAAAAKRPQLRLPEAEGMLEAFDRWDYSGLGSLPQRQAIKALRELFPALKQAAAVEATLHRAMHCCASGDVDGEGVRTNHTPTPTCLCVYCLTNVCGPSISLDSAAVQGACLPSTLW